MILAGDVVDQLPKIPADSVQCVVTSPPYYGLRDYGIPPTVWPEITFTPIAGLPPVTVPAETCCLGLESSIWAFLAHTVHVFRLVRPTLKADGVLWINIGDSYASRGGHADKSCNVRRAQYAIGNRPDADNRLARAGAQCGIKNKELLGIPWMLAFALRADGWYLRQDVIWSKPNPMPESVRDRCTKSHEYVFLLSKSERYYFDAEAIKEPAVSSDPPRVPVGWDTGPGAHCAIKHNQPAKSNGVGFGHGYDKERRERKRVVPRPEGQQHNEATLRAEPNGMRNKRSVWSIPTQPYKEAHFATYPEALAQTCVLAGSRPGDWVLDPFFGSGTTGLVCEQLQRNWYGIEVSPASVLLAARRVEGAQRGLVLPAHSDWVVAHEH